MPGNNDSGLNFLSYKKFNRRECFSEELNPNHNYVQSIDLTKDTSVLIYSNNLPTQLMDLGGVNCVQFYTNMVIDACEKYPKSDILLAGA